jgi:subtilisin family serine protease
MKLSRFGFGVGVLASLVGCGVDGSQAEVTSQTTSDLLSTQNYLVSLSGSGDPASIVTSAGGKIVATYPNVGIVLASGTTGFASALRADARVESVGLASTPTSSIRLPKGQHAPNSHSGNPARGDDPLSNRQWDMKQIHAPEARAISGGSSSVLVGVLDSGVDPTHPDLVGQVKASASASCVGGVATTAGADWANDVFGHGTHVSGIIAGAKNGVGIVGVAPKVKIAAVKVAIDDLNNPNAGLIFADAFVCAIDWAIAHNFDVMNSSLSIDPSTGVVDDIFCSDQPDRADVVKLVSRAVRAAAEKKIPLVASTANFFTDLSTLKGQTAGSTCKVLPVQVDRVIGVSAVGTTKLLSGYSNYGFGAVDVAGPGGDAALPYGPITDTDASGQVLSSIPPGSLFYDWASGWNGQVQDCSSGTCSTYAYLQGTSQAAPHVTGVAALAISKYGKMSPEALLALLSLTATPLPCPAGAYDPYGTGTPATCQGSKLYNNFYGAGEVDALAISR